MINLFATVNTALTTIDSGINELGHSAQQLLHMTTGATQALNIAVTTYAAETVATSIDEMVTSGVSRKDAHAYHCAIIDTSTPVSIVPPLPTSKSKAKK